MEEMITITKERYGQLFESEHFLNYLEACGVDNWEGYYCAKEMMAEECEQYNKNIREI